MKNGISINMTTVIDNFPAPIILIDCSHKIVFANAAANKFFGQEYITGDFCYKTFYNYDKPCGVPIYECPVRSFFETGELITTNHKGSKKFISSFDAGGSIVGLTFSIPADNSFDYQRIIHTGKMAALGSMLVHIVHNLNSSLYVSNNYINALKKKMEGDIKPEDITGYIKKIEDAGKLSSDMTKTLLDYTRHKESGSIIYAGEAVNEILSIFSTAFASHGIKVKITGQKNGPAVDRQAMLTTVFSIIQNAVDAMPRGGILSINISSSAITIKDTGKGMPADVQKKLFTPYFTTKQSGTGLGLYIAKKMMNSMNGDIKILSSEDKETEVKLLFPRREE